MDNFKVIYHILSSLEEQMDNSKVNTSKLDHEQLGVSLEKWANYIEMMQDAEYIKNCVIKRNIYDELIIDVSKIKITLRGLEYLQENSIM